MFLGAPDLRRVQETMARLDISPLLLVTLSADESSEPVVNWTQAVSHEPIPDAFLDQHLVPPGELSFLCSFAHR